MKISPLYIALDLETTGFNADSDQIIEIAALKFEGDQIIERFETLVNPQVPIPGMVTHITGIKAEDLVDAPTFDQVQSKLIEFLGNSPIIGHNISFDVTFLQQKGLPLKNPLYDTLQLSSILLPGLPSYSLDTLTRLYNITHTQKHRAMSDTEACYQLFLMLEEKIREIDGFAMAEIEKVLLKSHWNLKELFLQKGASKKRKKKTETITTSEEKTLIDTTKEMPSLSDFYGSKGYLSKTVPDYEVRSGQARMSEYIVEHFSSQKCALIEAGTGSGKTIAYLLSALLWGLSKHTKIVISTHTHHLQSQILENDLPLLQKIFQVLGLPPFRATLLKGRRNYLSLRRLEIFKEKNFFLEHEVSFLLKIILWRNQSNSGDLSEISLQGKEFPLLDEVCCAEHSCAHNDPDFKNGCALIKAREKAENAEFIIVNHALLIQNELAESPLLPEYNYLIIDEAHHLEKVVTDSLTITLSLNNFLRPFQKAEKTLDELSRDQKIEPAIRENVIVVKSQVENIVSRIEIFFGLIGIFLEKHLEPSQFQYQFTLSKNDQETLEWQKILQSARSILEIGAQLRKKLEEWIETFSANHQEKKQELKGSWYEMERRLTDMTTTLNKDQAEEQIRWLQKNMEESISLKSAPLQIGNELQKLLISKKESVIFTSATLRTSGNFEYVRSQLGLGQDCDELTIPSHFAYPEQVKIIIPQDLPEPQTEGYFMSCAELIEAIIKKNGGRTLALFTSKRALSATYHQIAPSLKEAGFTLLAQNITGGRGKILEYFKDEHANSAILGTSSFWEGVDLKGNDLTCVIMQKLPFDPPDDPIISARCKKYRDGFGEYQIPRAILRFKQGFGRLIRTNKDTGTIIILDTRILQKSYGHKFLESLPEGIKIKYTTKEGLTQLL